MAEFDVNRSVHLISLDTHPANNALTVTYEIIVSVVDRKSKRELARRSKRDQHQVHISALDQLNDKDLISDKLTINLQDLSLQVVKSCPMLQSERHNLEDIQLHLLYLVNRRKSQLLSGSNQNDRERSASSNSRRLNSGASSGRQSANLYGSRAGTAGQRRGSLSARANGSGFKDVYSYLLAKESTSVTCQQGEDDSFREFLDAFNQYLTEAEIEKWPNLSKYPPSHLVVPEELERLLEELYGSHEEREESMGKIRKLVQVDENLYHVTSNSLLISALLRTLRDQEARSNYISDSILFCITRMSFYSDTFESLCANTSDQTDLCRILVGILSENSKLLVASSEIQFLIDQYYFTNSLLVLLEISITYGTGCDKSSDGTKAPSKQVSVKQYVQQISELICALCKSFSTHLAAGIRMPTQNEKVTMLFNNLVSIMKRISVYSDFVKQLRLKQNVGFVEFLLNTLNCLQLSRPGSGVSFNERLDHIQDKITLNEIYELEINMMKVVNNLLYDQKLKQIFMRKNLVKCVLRNLVVFLASRKSNTLSPYHRSSVLITPFKCLYELSCSMRIRKELFKSKIITKCLLEYLLSCTSQLKYALSLMSNDKISAADPGKRASNTVNEDDYQVTIQPDSAEYYIVAIWVNLSVCNEATFFRDNVELRELICEYFELAIRNLHTLLSMADNYINDNYVLVFMHLKLIRNLSQFMEFNEEPMLWIDPYMRWVDLIGSAAERLLRKKGEPSAMMSVECVAIMSNWVSRRGQFEDLKIVPTSDWPKSTKNLLSALFEKDLCNIESDNDDLIMMAINLLGNLAKNCEICDEIADTRLEIIETLNYVFETKTTDQEMIICALYTLTQLLNHTNFLNLLSSATDGPVEKSVKKLVHSLCDFLLHGDSTIVGLAVSVLVVLRQLDEDSSMTESLVYRMRFMAYNSRWLKMIQAHLDDGLSEDADDQFRDDSKNTDATSEEISSDMQLNLAESGDLGQVVTLDEARSARKSSPQSCQNDTESQSTREDEKSGEGGLDLDDDDDELDYDEDDTFDEPDLNVIDAKSMIKHLTTRREFRSNWSTNIK